MMNIDIFSMKYENDDNCVIHAVLVPFPAQSHIKALMQVGELLAERGAFITFANTEWSEQRILEASKHKQLPQFRFVSFPDGLPPHHSRTTNIGRDLLPALQKSGLALERVLRTSADGIAVPPVTCIVADSFMSCTYAVAAKMGVARVVYWPLCAASSISHKYASLLYSQGHIPVKVSEAKRPEKLITTLPGNIPPLWPTDLLKAYREQYMSPSIYKSVLYESEIVNKPNNNDYVLVNTFEELEGKEAAAALSINGCPAVAIGPIFLPNFLHGKDSNSNMWEEDKSCLEWLDTQKPNSVIYVSFGILALKSQEQLDELALGLEQSGQPFLWVLRLDLAQGQGSAILPEGFSERIKHRRLIVSWTPQVKVLNHPSVGGFLTHSGWNSTLESISMGVPMIGWPSFADQFLNCRFAKEIWKVGMDFKDIDVDENRLVRREEVNSVVKTLMQSAEGYELRKRAMELKETATKAVLPGGSSFTNITTFVENMKKIAKSHLN